MKWKRLPLWYSVLSCGVSLLAVSLLLLQAYFGVPGLADPVFFFLLAGYLNCLPLAIVSLFLILKKESRKYGLLNFASIVLVLYFAIKVFGKSL